MLHRSVSISICASLFLFSSAAAADFSRSRDASRVQSFGGPDMGASLTQTSYSSVYNVSSDYMYSGSASLNYRVDGNLLGHTNNLFTAYVSGSSSKASQSPLTAYVSQYVVLGGSPVWSNWTSESSTSGSLAKDFPGYSKTVTAVDVTYGTSYFLFDVDVRFRVGGTFSVNASAAGRADDCVKWITTPYYTFCARYRDYVSGNATATASASTWAIVTASVGAGVNLGSLGFTGASAGASGYVDLMQATASQNAKSEFEQVSGTPYRCWNYSATRSAALSSLGGHLDLWASGDLFDWNVYYDSWRVLDWNAVPIASAADDIASGTECF
jgi:hypothetical protein